MTRLADSPTLLPRIRCLVEFNLSFIGGLAQRAARSDKGAWYLFLAHPSGRNMRLQGPIGC